MSHLGEALIEELNCETVFTIPIFGGIPIAESVFVSWFIIAFIAIGCFLLTRNLKVHNISKRQAFVEFAVTKLQDLFAGNVGHHGTQYIPYLVTVLIYLVIANIIGYFGIKPPTKDLNVTLALSVMSIVLIQAAGMRKKKFGGWLKSFSQPTAVVTPFNILELVIKPLSLCMRLFGNIMGAFVVMELIKHVVPVGVPAIIGLYFDFFDGIIQAYVFCFLTSLYIGEAVE